MTTFDAIHSITPHGLLQAALWFGAYWIFLFAAHFVLPGPKRQGVPLKSGERLTYKLSGFASFLVCYVLAIGLSATTSFSLRPLVENFWSLFVVINVFSFVYAAALFVVGRRARAQRNEPSQSLGLDLWVGPELNPSFLGVDLKMFTYQPSLIGLGLVNLAFAYVQYESYGTITLQMMLYQAFWWVYLFTHYMAEEFMLQTWDIIAENFGFMLVWGDLIYVPFFYSIVGWFLVDQTQSISVPQAVAIGSLFAASLWLFRGSNMQKFKFKRDPQTRIWGERAEAMGGRLLVSGFWGYGRKLNYTGEIGVYLSIALCAGFSSPVPYILPLSLLILLSHRAWRDERRCGDKYGPLWAEYCKRVPYRMFPFLY